jgi:hypothetical protein
MGKRMRSLTIVLVILAAACGGGDGDDAAAPQGGSDSTTTAGAVATTAGAVTTTAAVATTAAAVTGNPGDEFCQYLTDHATEFAEQFNIMSMSADEIEAALRANLDAMNHARDIAPSELRADVEAYAVAYGGFIDFLDEYDFNFLSMPEDAMDDPRLQALDDPALNESGARIEEYCGLDSFIASPPSAPTTDGGGGTVQPGGEVPEDFPAALEPPGGKVVATVSAGGASFVTFELSSGADELIAFYTDILGDPLQVMDDPAGALWITSYEGLGLNLVVSEVGGGLTDVTVTYGA